MDHRVRLFCALFMLSGFVPLGRAWLALGRTTLRPSLSWALAAWATWCGVAGKEALEPEVQAAMLRWMALALTACAGIAVLGARRPGVTAWNFVVLALLAILMMPAARGFGRISLQGSDVFFGAATIAVGLLNYLPTRLGFAAALLAFCCGEALEAVAGAGEFWQLHPATLAYLGVVPWLGWVCWRLGGHAGSRFAATWRAFRDRYGWLWAQRMRDQFNRAVANAGWRVELHWRGLERKDASAVPTEGELLATLEDLLKRFDREKPAHQQLAPH